MSTAITVVSKFLKRLKFVLMLTTLTVPNLGYAHPVSYFQPEAVACEIKKHIDQRGTYSKERFEKDLFQANSFTNDLAEHSGGWIRRQVYKRLRAHSIPLAMVGNNVDLNEEGTDLWTGIERSRTEAFQDKNNLKDLTIFDNSLDEITAKSNSLYFDDSEIEAFNISKTLRNANPLINWLLSQPKGSVKLTSLLKRGLELYEDNLVVTIGIIGTLFDEERMMSHPRNKLAVLNSKMYPLWKNDVDPYGSNYHFWAYLSMALKGDRVAPGLFSFAYERVYQSDAGDYAADQLGLEMGYMLRTLIFSKKSNCYLNP